MRSPRRLRTVVAALAAAAPFAAAAQSHCKPPADRSEAKQLAWFAAPLSFSAAPEVFGLTFGQVTLAGDLTLVRAAPDEINHSSGYCGFDKSENSDLAPVFPRPRIALGLGGGLAVEASYLPPVTVMDATPNLGGLALSWSPSGVTLLGGTQVHLRAHSTFGSVRGPITCSREALQSDPTKPCNGTTPSNDTYNPNVRGVEAVLARQAGSLRWYAGGGMNFLTSHFLVDFTDRNGFRDNNTVEIDLTRVALMAGASWAWRPDLSFSAQLYSVPEDATTARVGIAWRAR
jgi:hypothetical protein